MVHLVSSCGCAMGDGCIRVGMGAEDTIAVAVGES